MRPPFTNTIIPPGPPAAKKRKTRPVPVAGDKEGEKAENGTKGDKDQDEEEPAEGEGEEEEPVDTAKTSGPAEAAAKAKGADVPKESDLREVEAEE